VAQSAEFIEAGAEAERLHSYVVRALELLEDAEASAVLAASGDRGALSAIECIARDLDALHVALEEEHPGSGGGR
jgi:hypothetical protein